MAAKQKKQDGFQKNKKNSPFFLSPLAPTSSPHTQAAPNTSPRLPLLQRRRWLQLHSPRPETLEITLHRPEAFNALHQELIEEIIEVFQTLQTTPSVRVVVLRGNGASFCAGGDLRWMQQAKSLTPSANRAQTRDLASAFHLIQTCPQVLIAEAHGPVRGGGLGLVSACDLVVAVSATTFCFSEVSLGLIPACIAPLVVAKIGFSAARRFFLTAEPFSAQEAQTLGLVHHVTTSPQESAQVTARWLTQLLHNGPQALRQTKALLQTLAAASTPGLTDRKQSGKSPKKDPPTPLLPPVFAAMAELLARNRVMPEAQEGVSAFLEKRAPRWQAATEPAAREKTKKRAKNRKVTP